MTTRRIDATIAAGLALQWIDAHPTDIALAARVARVPRRSLIAPVYEAAYRRALRGEALDAQTPRIVTAALRAIAVRPPVSRPHRGRKPRGMTLDDAPSAALGDITDPLTAMVAAESEREWEDWSDDHEDRISLAADRCARGLPPVPTSPRGGRSASSLRRDRAAERAMHAAGIFQAAFRGWGWQP